MFINKVSLYNYNSQNLNINKKHNNLCQTNMLSKSSCDSVSFARKPAVKDVVNVFNQYKPRKIDFGTYKIPVHNDSIAKKLQPQYSPKSFDSLYKYANKNGVFDFNINPKTHYVQTSLIDPSENPLMSKLIWVTDSCNVMPLLKNRNPEVCLPLFENLSDFYAKQDRNFNKIIKNPDLYELNHDYAKTAKNGVGHVFNPENFVSHKWFTRTRLDSLGLYLGTASDLIYDGLSGAKYGYKSANKISKNTMETFSNVTRYLKSLNYAYTKDCGAWEEKTFNATTTSDVAIINEAYRKMLKLVYEPTKNPEIIKFRKNLLKTKNGVVFTDENALRQQLKIGEYRIKTNSKEEIPNERLFDGAMGFIFKTEKLHDDPVKNAKAVIERLMALETGSQNSAEIVRENGVLRYIDDKYLNLNANIVGKNPEYNKIFPSKKTEAQWFMVSDISTSYGKIAKSLMDKIEKDGKSTPEIEEILNFVLKKETEYINRSYARITGKNSYKANGVKAPVFQVPEAYQAVTDTKGNVKFVPGTHTPLAWGQASLFEASEMFAENLSRLQNKN